MKPEYICQLFFIGKMFQKITSDIDIETCDQSDEEKRHDQQKDKDKDI